MTRVARPFNAVDESGAPGAVLKPLAAVGPVIEMAVMNRSWPSIGAFLKEHRGLISRGATALGPHPRLPARHGKGVTQEEIAEAIGVSRVWYAMLESGAALHTFAASTGAACRPRSRCRMRAARHSFGSVCPNSRSAIWTPRCKTCRARFPHCAR